MKNLLALAILLCSLALFSCNKNKSDDPAPNSKITGSGSFTYDFFDDRPIEVFYNVPANINLTSRVLFIFHGNARDARENRDYLIQKSNQLGVIIIVPEFSQDYFPGGDAYNLGNIFIDGDNPSASTLNPREEWTFSCIEPLFDNVKNLTGISTNTYDIFGHSAGAQVAHRYLFFFSDARVNRIVANASGWYTFPANDVEFPYGFGNSPADTLKPSSYFSKYLHITVGEEDNDPDAPGLRHTEEADNQGMHRLERALTFYQSSFQMANQLQVEFSWKYTTLNNVGHEFEPASIFAMDLLY